MPAAAERSPSIAMRGARGAAEPRGLRRRLARRTAVGERRTRGRTRRDRRRPIARAPPRASGTKPCEFGIVAQLAARLAEQVHARRPAAAHQQQIARRPSPPRAPPVGVSAGPGNAMAAAAAGHGALPCARKCLRRARPPDLHRPRLRAGRRSAATATPAACRSSAARYALSCAVATTARVPGAHAVALQVGARRIGQHDPGTVVGGKHQRALQRAGREDHFRRAHLPQPLARQMRRRARRGGRSRARTGRACCARNSRMPSCAAAASRAARARVSPAPRQATPAPASPRCGLPLPRAASRRVPLARRRGSRAPRPQPPPARRQGRPGRRRPPARRNAHSGRHSGRDRAGTGRGPAPPPRGSPVHTGASTRLPAI